MFSDFNNPDIYDVLRVSVYDNDFGFTEEEVSQLCTDAQLREIRDWYNGYRIGASKVYFTYSVMSYLKSERLACYWGQSGLIDNIASHLTPGRFDTITKILGESGKEQQRVAIADRLTSDDIATYRRDDAFYSLLVQSGYLTYDFVEGSASSEVYLPNRELESVWRAFILSKLYNEVSDNIVSALSLISDPVRFIAAFTPLLVNKLSYFDFESDEPEKTYHVYVAGLLAACGFKFSSNRESGFGRYDLNALLADKTIIFEFKLSKSSSKEALEKAAGEAIEQMQRNGYQADAPSGKPVFGVGIGFYSKIAQVKALRIR